MRAMSKVNNFLGIIHRSLCRVHSPSELYHMSWPSVVAILAVTTIYAAVAFGSTGGAVAQESPISPGPTPEGGVASYWSFMPLILKNSNQYTYYPPTTIPIVLSCSDDACARGDFYRSLVSNTITILNPLAGWVSEGCSCGLLDARARGAAFG